MKKTKISFVVPEVLQHELRQRIAAEGYGLRGKSKWVSEAIDQLLNLNNFTDLVMYSEEMQGFQKTETIVIDALLKQQLDDAILKVRLDHPRLEGVQSAIARTAIVQRFLRT